MSRYSRRRVYQAAVADATRAASVGSVRRAVRSNDVRIALRPDIHHQTTGQMHVVDMSPSEQVPCDSRWRRFPRRTARRDRLCTIQTMSRLDRATIREEQREKPLDRAATTIVP